MTIHMRIREKCSQHQCFLKAVRSRALQRIALWQPRSALSARKYSPRQGKICIRKIATCRKPRQEKWKIAPANPSSAAPPPLKLSQIINRASRAARGFGENAYRIREKHGPQPAAARKSRRHKGKTRINTAGQARAAVQNLSNSVKQKNSSCAESAKTLIEQGKNEETGSESEGNPCAKRKKHGPLSRLMWKNRPKS